MACTQPATACTSRTCLPKHCELSISAKKNCSSSATDAFLFPRLSPRGRDLSQSANGLRKSTMRSLHSHAICAVWGFSILQTCSAFYSSAPYPARVGRNRGQLRMVAHVEPVLTLLLADSAPSLRYNHFWALFAVIVRVGSTRRTRTGRRRCCITGAFRIP